MTTWILLRGLGREQAHWGAFQDALRARIPAGDTVLPVDLPGNGKRHRESSPLTVQGMLHAVRAEVAGAASRKPCVVVALSLGGMVALEWASTCPAEVHACILVNTSLRACSPFWQRLRPTAYPALLRWLLPGSLARREASVLAATSNRPLDAMVLAAWVGIATQRPVRRLNVLRQLLGAGRFRAPARIRVPTLVIASRGDRLVSPACSEAIAQANGLPLAQHPWAGHDLPLDDPCWLAERIAGWAAQGFPGRASG